MSKSDPNEKSRVLILDSPDLVRKKIRSAVTDSDPDVRFDPEAKPGISNLLEIMATCTERSVDSLVDEYGSGGYGKFKDAVADAVIATLAPIRSAYQSLEDEEVARMMRRGALDARTRAEGFQQIVREATGLAAI
jgi:tryptophanyl-tRNA synthetase